MATSLYTSKSIQRPSTSQVRPQMYRGFSTVNTKTNNFALYDFELIKQDLINNFNVRQGERLMNPDFGCAIWDLLFEPLTGQIQDIILRNVTTIINYDPRVQAGDVTVSSYDTGIQITFNLTYVTYNVSEILRVQFDQNNGISVNPATSSVTTNIQNANGQ